MGYLTAPYIWLWVLVEISHEQGDPILRDWGFADYGEQKAFLNPVLSLKAKSWQSFEKFVASFRCIKSAVIKEDELTTISKVHAGARLNGDIQFKNHNLQLKIARHQTDTKSKNLTIGEWNVDCSNTTVDVWRFKHCIINAPGSPYGNAFLSLDQPGAESPNEILQHKLTQKPISQEVFEQEHKKSASENDFFILFTTADNCIIKLPKRSGIVDGKVFRDYFGPFAGRAYRSAMSESKHDKIKNIPKVNINTASLDQLCRVNHIGKKRANKIILGRPFKRPSHDFSHSASIHAKIDRNLNRDIIRNQFLGKILMMSKDKLLDEPKQIQIPPAPSNRRREISVNVIMVVSTSTKNSLFFSDFLNCGLINENMRINKYESVPSKESDVEYGQNQTRDLNDTGETSENLWMHDAKESQETIRYFIDIKSSG
ncbi:9910_t:CDS:2 [Acaulospora morrowiae]|uniref:9910_t:CDS:1 n=1 Tax=Acaulospora morrowiae TaxID=94023 RepID=A0A9N8WIE6_9GLOM|nr:9910_t:CDS:2 [Acaulospora morrowiae]